MQDYYYRFPSSGIAYQVAFNAGFLVSGENGWKLNAFTQDYAIDLIGPTEDNQDKYHLNLRVLNDVFPLPSGAEPYRIDPPSSPVRQWL